MDGMSRETPAQIAARYLEWLEARPGVSLGDVPLVDDPARLNDLAVRLARANADRQQ